MSSRQQTTTLGEIAPARSRHAGRRSAVVADGGIVAVGTASGDVRVFEGDSLTERWRADPNTDHGETTLSVVSAAISDDLLIVGERSPRGGIRGYDLDSGALIFRHESADDVGQPARDTRFFLPFVVDTVADGRFYVAARRYERDGEDRSFESVVYALDPDGTICWRYRTDASAISLDIAENRLAVAYNRCPGDHQHGLVILDTETGRPRWQWDPGTDGQRRVGDVALGPDGVAVASHGDYRGYRLDSGGAVRWQAELAPPTDIDQQTLYAYPNHVHATSGGVLFVTGNTYAEQSRETDNPHPHEHTVFGYRTGERRWTAGIGGFAHGVGTAGDRVAVPSAQHFRERNPDSHGFSLFDIADGRLESSSIEGVVTATALDGDQISFVEEPVSYHDGDQNHGQYRLHTVPAP